VGLVGASGSGKTYSALRLAKGFGGKTFVIDTEARRALWYADAFQFEHVDFRPPFGPLDYLAAIEHCVKGGAQNIIIDSMSHEHQGAGGVLEMHETEAQRLAAQWRTTLDKVKMSAWQLPKAQRTQLVQYMLQASVNFILCFRAKEKMDLRGDKPKVLGWMPVAGEEYVYEMTVNCLLYPNGGGVPQWHPDEMGEKAIIKLPAQFRELFAGKGPLDEKIGKGLADWAVGGAKVVKPVGPFATKEQVEEITVEIRRLKWTVAVAKEWLSQYGATTPAEIPLDRAIAALNDLMHRKDP
jgi:hypothetical protein